MREKVIYLLRHGETDLNRRGVVQGSGVDASLNEAGRRQAQAFYERYRHVPFDIVITSALRRTHETVSPFLKAGLPWEQFPDINEICWGQHEGRASTPEMVAEYRQVISRWQAGDLRVGLASGETAQHMQARLIRFTEWLKARPERSLLICSHGRAMRCLLCIMKDLPPDNMEEFQNQNTGLYRIQCQDNRFIFDLENDLSHLNL